MAVRWQELEKGYVRRREAEHNRATHTQELNRYYDHWSKVTARHRNWSGPQYYEKAEQKIQRQREKEEKNARLAERRQRMRELLDSERIVYEELMEKKRPRSRRDKAISELLFKIDQNMKDRAQIRDRLDNEARMCGRWRKRPEDENPLLEAKNDLPPPVRTNWPQSQKESESRVQELKDEEQCNARLQAKLVREEIRAEELKEACATQEDQLAQLNRRQREADQLKDDAYNIRLSLDELDKELELLEESSAVIMEPGELAEAFNRNKMKVLIRKRSELYRRQITLCINILERVETYAGKCAKVQELKNKYKEQMEAESSALPRIEEMCESDGKMSLKRCEDQWVAEHMARHLELKALLKNLRVKFDENLNANLERQQEIIEITNTHLMKIENSNEKMKQLVEEDEKEASFRGMPTKEMPSIKTPVERHLSELRSPISSSSVSSKRTVGRMLSEQPSTSTLSAPYGTYSDPLPSRQSLDSYDPPSPGSRSLHVSFGSPAGKSSESLAASQSFLTRKNRSATMQSSGDSARSNTFKTSMDFPMTTSTTMRNLPLKSCPKFDDAKYKDLQHDMPPHLGRSFSNFNLEEGAAATTKRSGAADRASQNTHLDNVVVPPKFGRKRVPWT